MILTVTLNPSIDYTLFVDQLLIGDTNRVQRTEIDAGGKGINLSRIATVMGGETLAIGLGGGSPMKRIVHVLEQENVPNKLLKVRGETRLNFNIETTSHEPPTTLNSPGPEISTAEWSSLLELVRSELTRTKWLCVGGSLPKGVPEDAYFQLGNLAKAAGVPWMLDADKNPMQLGMKAHPNFIKPNRHETERVLQRPLTTQQDVIDASKELYENLGDANGERLVIISLGGDGAVMTCEEGTYVGTAPKIEVKSTIGSGDSLIAGVLTSACRGESWEVALRWGIAAGAATAMSSGAAIGNKFDIESCFSKVLVRP